MCHESAVKKLLSPKQVAQGIGVSESSIKRWCDSGVIRTVRTAGGHRRLQINSVVQFLRDGGHELIHPEALGLERAISSVRWTLPEARVRFRDALVAGDGALARNVVLGLYFANQPVSLIADQVIALAFHDIGDLWHCGDVEIYEERRSCEICLNALRDLGICLPSPADGAQSAIGGTLEGDPYAIAVTLAELVLRDKGWEASALGNSLPTETLCTAIRDCQPRLVWVGVSFIPDETLLIDSMNQLFKCASEHGAALAIGGSAPGPELRRRLSCSTYCETFQHLEQFAETI